MISRFDPEVTPWVEVYRRLTEVVIPRPIAVVSTVDAEGRANLAPFSFFNVVSCNPPHLAFAPQRSGRTGEAKDTLCNVEEVGEFVVAVATEDVAGKVNACSASFARGESEFERAGLTPAPSLRVRPHLVRESPVNLECEVVEIRTYGSGPGAGSLVVGRLVMMHVDESVMSDTGAVTPDLLRAVGRMGGDFWVRTRDTFTLERPASPPREG